MDRTPPRGFWRTQIEAFAVAIAVALAVKTFAIEAYQVPTDSMEPTIVGRNPGGDHLLVSRTSMLTNEPERFDVLVFRYPLSRGLNYIKRLAGLPGERIEIHHGDLYVASKTAPNLQIVRKPDAVQAALFDAHDVIPQARTKDFTPTSFEAIWRVPRGAEVRYENARDGGSVTLEAMGAERSRYQLMVPLDPVRRDRLSSDRTGKGDQMLEGTPMSDIRLRGKIDVEARFAIELQDGTSAPIAIWRAVVQRSGSSIAVELFGGPRDAQRSVANGKAEVDSGPFDFEFENVDDRIRFRIDSQVVLEHSYIQPPDADFRPIMSKSDLHLVALEGKTKIERMELHRDIYYSRFDATRPPVYEVPEQHYFFLGDNSVNSLDARGWLATAIRIRESGLVLVGDREAVSDDFAWPRRESNPYFDEERTGPETKRIVSQDHLFLDIHGNQWRLAPESYDILNLSKLVPDGTREVLDLHGKVLAIPPEAIAKAAVTTGDLTSLAAKLQIGDLPQRGQCTLMHFVHRDDIVGQAWFVFAPGAIWQVIKAWTWRTIR